MNDEVEKMTFSQAMSRLEMGICIQREGSSKIIFLMRSVRMIFRGKGRDNPKISDKVRVVYIEEKGCTPSMWRPDTSDLTDKDWVAIYLSPDDVGTGGDSSDDYEFADSDEDGDY